MYQVYLGTDRYNFSSIEAARAHAEKESWLRNTTAVIRNGRNIIATIKIDLPI